MSDLSIATITHTTDGVHLVLAELAGVEYGPCSQLETVPPLRSGERVLVGWLDDDTPFVLGRLA